MNFDAIKPDTTFTHGGSPADFTMCDFWLFKYRNIYDIQGDIAEFIVSRALGIHLPSNNIGWRLWDIDYKGFRIEIKQTSFFHSWRAHKITPMHNIFDIHESYTEYKNRNSELKRQADMYVFCVNTGITYEESNPLELDNWVFHVVPTSKLYEECGRNKTVSLRRILKIAPPIPYCRLKSEIDKEILSF